jgi:nitrogenase subunit NifH
MNRSESKPPVIANQIRTNNPFCQPLFFLSLQKNDMATIVINERTKIGKNVMEMLKALAKADENQSIKFLDETEYLLSAEANKKALMHGISPNNVFPTG